MELTDPDLFQQIADLNFLEVLHKLCNEFRVFLDIFVLTKLHDDEFIKELPEVVSNWQIDKYLLVKCSVVVALNCSDVLYFSELTKWVKVSKQSLKRVVVFDSFDYRNDVIDLITVQHHLKETCQGLSTLSNHMLKFFSQFLLAKIV